MKPALTLCLLFAAAQHVLPDESAGKEVVSLTTQLTPAEDSVRLKFSGLLDIEGYALPTTSPGLIYTDSSALFNPRLSIFIDGQFGSKFYFFSQTRFDRGFDPSENDLQARWDEYALRYTPWEDGRLNLQIGKFATIAGNFSERHLSWDNPFVNAPLVYENLTGIWDMWGVDSARTLLEWSHVPTPYFPEFGDGYYDKDLRVPVIWGASYATGISAAGRLGEFEYAAEMKNAGLSSRPQSWDLTEVDFSHPAWAARAGWRPNMAWNLGLSAATGPYMTDEAADSLPAGTDVDDFQQITFGHDISFQWHHWQLWGEVWWSRFEVPTVGDTDTVAYYLEAKYKFTPQLYGAVRWNQQFFSDIPFEGGEMPWGRDIWRLDTAIGYRFTPRTQLKLQYGLQHERYNTEDYEHLFAAQFTAKF